MATATATRTYSPTITEASPKNEQQRALAAQGFRGFWVEANSKRLVNGLRIVRYLLTVMPGGWVKCPCYAGVHAKAPCCHKLALFAHLEREQDQADEIAAEKDDALELLDRDTPDDELEDEPTIEQRREAALNRIERETAIVDSIAARQAGAARSRAAKREAELDQAERSAKAERAVIQNHTPERFSVFACVR